jgi:hypothetical protein
LLSDESAKIGEDSNYIFVILRAVVASGATDHSVAVPANCCAFLRTYP